MIRGKRSPINPKDIFPESDEWAIYLKAQFFRPYLHVMLKLDIQKGIEP